MNDLIYFFTFIYLYILNLLCMEEVFFHGSCIGITLQLGGEVYFLFLPYGFLGLDSSYRARQQNLLPTEITH